MADSSKISKSFYRHPKVRLARESDPGSISLWLVMNCFCRDHRRQGRFSRDEALQFGTESEIKSLVDSGLWSESGDEIEFHDWGDWNPDMVRAGVYTTARWIVHQAIPDHPELAQERLAREAEKLLDEGVPLSAVKAGVVTWGQRENARFGWLAYFVSDAMRANGGGISAAIREARQTWNMAPLKQFGHVWAAPDIPEGLRTAKQVRSFMRQKKSEWLDRIEAKIDSTA